MINVSLRVIYYMQIMQIMLSDEEEIEETTDPVVKNLNLSHSCVMKYILFGHVRCLLPFREACPFFVKLRSSPMRFRLLDEHHTAVVVKSKTALVQGGSVGSVKWNN